MVIPFVLLLVGLAAAAFLLTTSQDLRQQAAGESYAICTPGQSKCSEDGSATQTCVGGKWESMPCIKSYKGVEVKCEMVNNKASCEYAYCFLATDQSTRCNGSNVEACMGDGSWKVVEHCTANQTCGRKYVGEGTSVLGCVPNCGTTGQRSCSDDGRAVRTCTESGDWQIETCPADKTCKKSGGIFSRIDCF